MINSCLGNVTPTRGTGDISFSKVLADAPTPVEHEMDKIGIARLDGAEETAERGKSFPTSL